MSSKRIAAKPAYFAPGDHTNRKPKKKPTTKQLAVKKKKVHPPKAVLPAPTEQQKNRILIDKHDDILSSLNSLVPTFEEVLRLEDSSTKNLLLSYFAQQHFKQNKEEIEAKKSDKRNSKKLDLNKVIVYTRQTMLVIETALNELHNSYYRGGVHLTTDNDFDTNGKKLASGGNKRIQCCKACKTNVLVMKKLSRKGSLQVWFIKELNYTHGQQCQDLLTSASGTEKYKVDKAILDVAESLKTISEKWWRKVCRNQLANSIMDDRNPGDARFYGIFYLQLPFQAPGSNFQAFVDMATTSSYSLEEVNNFTSFFEMTRPNKKIKKSISLLVVLFLEDFKFVKRLHEAFASNELYFANMGFIAGGKKKQQLHRDTNDLPIGMNSSMPVSVLLPIAPAGRFIHFHDSIEPENKVLIKYGEAVSFDATVIHAGAVSEGNPLDHLAFHIHIDNHFFIRNPNFLEVVCDKKDDDEQEEQGVADKDEEVVPQNKEDGDEEEEEDDEEEKEEDEEEAVEEEEDHDDDDETDEEHLWHKNKKTKNTLG